MTPESNEQLSRPQLILLMIAIAMAGYLGGEILTYMRDFFRAGMGRI